MIDIYEVAGMGVVTKENMSVSHHLKPLSLAVFCYSTLLLGLIDSNCTQ